jgi:hypothetical protein
VSRRRERKKLRKPLIAAEVLARKRKRNRERVELGNTLGRTMFLSMHHSVLDAKRKSVAQNYRENLDGCRALWTQRYRQKKALRLSQIDKP